VGAGVEVFLVRHGETQTNVTGERLYDPELTERGRLQARLLGAALRAEAPTFVAASPLRRAVQTACAVAEAAGAPLHVWNDLVEWNRWDPYTGPARGELRRLFPRAVLEPGMPPDGWSYPGPEPEAEASARAARVAARVSALPAGCRAVLVAHGAFNGLLLALWLRAGPGAAFVQDNAAISRLALGPAGVLLHACNDVRHLLRGGGPRTGGERPPPTRVER
jgi:broad specificity phosphatase PhoE